MIQGLQLPPISDRLQVTRPFARQYRCSSFIRLSPLPVFLPSLRLPPTIFFFNIISSFHLLALLLINVALSSFVCSSDDLAQSRLVVVPAAAGVAEVARITDAANAALLRLVALARERADAFKVRCVCVPLLALNFFLNLSCIVAEI